jgi:predicted RNA-binding Zn-ribbon protein involved in translation (DUF1610 family)
MSDSEHATEFRCTQCGGELHPDEGQIFLTCPFCGSTVFLDKSQVVFHWYLAPTLDEAKARGSLARWMAGNDTVKDLDKKAKLLSSTFEYFPIWHFKRQFENGSEQFLHHPAAATSVTEIRQINLPAGDLRKYDASLEAKSHPPTVPLETALGWLAFQNIPAGQIVERSLVHIPVYTFKYSYQAGSYTALVEGATGTVFANLYPAKAESPYRLAGGLAALVFLILATFPVMGALIDGTEGAGIGLIGCSGLGLIAAPALFALAAWVAAKV